MQRSVFEGEMSRHQFQQMRSKVSKIKLGPEDSVRYYVICAACEEKVVIDGEGDLVRAPKHFIV